MINGQFQSDKYPECPPGKVPLSVTDKMAQDLLWEYAQRRKEIDEEFSNDLEDALYREGYDPESQETIQSMKKELQDFRDEKESAEETDRLNADLGT